MNCLIIDCSSGMNIYLVKDAENYSYIDLEQKKHTDNLLQKIDELLKEAALTIKDIDVLGLCVGPGSFTGIRVAVSVIKGLAVTSTAKICIATNFEIYNCKTNSILVLEGFSNFVYISAKIDKLNKASCIDINELIDLVKNNNLIIYAENKKVQNMLLNVEIQSEIATKDTLNCFYKKINNKEFVNINQIEPVYLRASQAEIERQKRLNNKNEI